MKGNEIITIPMIVYQSAMNAKDKTIRNLIVALVILSISFVAYISVDRYLDNDVSDAMTVSQQANDTGKNLYNSNGVVNGVPNSND